MDTYTLRRKMITLKNLGSDLDKKKIESAELELELANAKVQLAMTNKRIAEILLAGNLLKMVQVGVLIKEENDPDFSICGHCEFKTCHLCELPDNLREAH